MHHAHSTFKLKATNDDEAVVIKDNKVISSFFVRSSNNEEPEPHSPRCCGRTTANKDVTNIEIGKFERKSSGGSFKVTLY